MPNWLPPSFQKILDHPGVTVNFPVSALISLSASRGPAPSQTGARTAYQHFFALWKDADPDLPILKEAKAEYADLR